MGALEAGRVGIHAQRTQGGQLLQALGGLPGPARDGRLRLPPRLAHARGAPFTRGVSAVGRTRRRMASSTPFTKAGESASPNRLAISTASSRITAAGVAGSHISS